MNTPGWNLDPQWWWQRLHRGVWERRPGDLPPARAALLRAARVAWALVRDVTGGQIALHAMSLVYTTLLSLVPLLAVSFSVLKAFGVHNQIQPLLGNAFAPLGEEGRIMVLRLTQFIENVNVGVLGATGLAFLVYTVISLMQKIEAAFNFIWQVPRSRGLGERFSRYLSVLLIGPLLVFAALGVTASVLNSAVVAHLVAFAPLVYVAGKIAPYFMVVAAFTFVYLFIPNARVRFWPALAAGITGGVLWQTAGWAFAAFVAGSSKYEAIYAGFAVLLLFMIWMYVSWFIVLFGAAVGFYLQHPEYTAVQRGEPRLSNRLRERLALAIMNVVGTRHLTGTGAPTLDDITAAIQVPAYAVDVMVRALEHGGVVIATRADPPAYVPARDLDGMTVHDILRTARAASEDSYLNADLVPLATPVERAVERIERSLTTAAASMSVRDLVEGTGVPSGAPPATAARFGPVAAHGAESASEATRQH